MSLSSDEIFQAPVVLVHRIFIFFSWILTAEENVPYIMLIQQHSMTLKVLMHYDNENHVANARNSL